MDALAGTTQSLTFAAGVRAARNVIQHLDVSIPDTSR
jgi:hypothetical protein